MTKIDLSAYAHKVLMTEDNYSIIQFEGMPREVITFLKEINWGAEGAVYQNMDTEKVFNAIPDPFLVAILEEGVILATGAFCRTSVSVENDEYPCYYVRFFSASPLIRGKGITKKYTTRIMELIAENTSQKTIYFANVERGNKASYNVVKHSGYNHLFTFNTIGFSRFFPKKNGSVTKVKTDQDKKEIQELLQTYYDNYAMVHFDTLFSNDNYRVIKRNGEIVAGCQYYRVHWVIHKMPGWTGKLIMKVLPKLPLINRIFNPERFEFLAFDSIFLKAGHEKELSQLFEHILATEKLNSSLMWLGSTSPLIADIQANMKLGILHKFVSSSSVSCMVRTENFSEKEIQKLKNAPVFAPAFDFI